jgi:predicted alpha-1,2-mannosidase
LAADYREGCKLPRWAEQNFDAAHMSGDPAIPMIADGVCRGLLDRPEDAAAVADLYRGAVELADVHRPAEMHTLGYLPGRPGTTLEYGVADFALALLGDRLGHSADADRFLADSLRYRTILDPDTKWVRPRAADGSWSTPFDPSDETGFQEGNSWQYSWLAPHDARGLFDRMGGDGVAADRLDQLFAAPPEVQTRATAFGLDYRVPQYAPGNEHDLQVPAMYAFAGKPARAQAELRELDQVFRATPDGLPGNDDLGSLSAWYAWNALGLMPVTPGAPFLVIGSPRFARVELDVGDGAPFTIDAAGGSDLAPYVQRAEVDGHAVGASWVPSTTLRPGRGLRLTLGPTPDTSPHAPPPSASTDPLAAFGCHL